MSMNLRPFQQASADELRALLDLYPRQVLKKAFDESGTKEEIVATVSGRRSYHKIAAMVRQYITCCRQRIYVMRHSSRNVNKLKELVENPLGTEGLIDVSFSKDGKLGSYFYLIPVTLPIWVVTDSGVALKEVSFRWPVKISLKPNYAALRCVKLETSAARYTKHEILKTLRRSVEESHLLEALEINWSQKGCRPVDISKGVKALWAEGFMDASEAQFRQDNSTERQDMDSDKLLKRDEPERYKDAIRRPITRTDFVILSDAIDISRVRIEPLKGYIGIQTYSAEPNDTKYLIERILEKN